MPVLTDFIAALDAAATPISAALKVNGPAYLNSDGGAIWLLTYDPHEFCGFRATAVPKASGVPASEVIPPPTVASPAP